jgi:hypothetical protein
VGDDEADEGDERGDTADHVRPVTWETPRYRRSGRYLHELSRLPEIERRRHLPRLGVDLQHVRTDSIGSGRTASRVRSITSAIPRNPSRPSRNACTAISSAALNTHGATPARPAGPIGQVERPEGLGVDRLELEGEARQPELDPDGHPAGE